MSAIVAGLSLQDYLTLERGSRLRHDYRAGMVYPIPVQSANHQRISSNLSYLIATNLQRRGREFQLFTGDARISDGATFLYYPDLFVTVDPRDFEDGKTKCYPKLIAKIVTPATEFFDRTQKFADCRQFNTLEEYLLIDRDRMRVESRRRRKTGNHQEWEIAVYEVQQSIALTSLGTKMDLSELYRGVSWNS